MKKLISFLALAFLSLSVFATETDGDGDKSNSQNKKGAQQVNMSGMELGLRLTDGWNAGIDFVYNLGGANRIHAGMTFGSGGVGLEGFYDWNFVVDQKIKFYVGPGVGLGLHDDFTLGIGGEGGVEYQFNAPITVGFDWRPMLNFFGNNGEGGSNTNFNAGNFGVNVRYRF
ncbi:outer membrane insertion C- signal [Sediminitomix flava]|uniref:Putative outer membrane protein n=1 Tax=Sediminitomix flava TaxID=379075 RepID=A0A315ZE74_SEDFL|nr:outer membrane insertion C- signal [Sediminitomix flava]PWJ43916.1 putative outer membrane protein [Sediminitomix flava]